MHQAVCEMFLVSGLVGVFCRAIWEVTNPNRALFPKHAALGWMLGTFQFILFVAVAGMFVFIIYRIQISDPQHTFGFQPQIIHHQYYRHHSPLSQTRSRTKSVVKKGSV